MKSIVIDIYGADAGPEMIVEGTALAMEQGWEFFPVLVGEKALITPIMEGFGVKESAYEVVDTSDFIAQTEPPSVIFGGRDNASMALGYTRLKHDDNCMALLSPGNTGALLVGSICRLGLVGKLKFPALISALPCREEKLLSLVDCGANINTTVEDLVHYARMGNVFSKCFCGVEQPRVGLMSVGREEGKGTKLLQEAYQKIKELPLHFVGNLEGSDMVSDYADVIVCDGLSGNLLLKNTEAAGWYAFSAIEKLGLEKEVTEKIRRAFIQRFDFNRRGAATFLGPKKTVVKMHGCATKETVVASIDQILRLEKAEFSRHIAQEMAQ